MEKITIYATGNERITGDYNISFYIVAKEERFLDWLGYLLEEVLGMEDGKYKALNYSRILENGETEYTLKDIKKMTNKRETYESGGNRVDIFYGDKRVFLTFRKDRDARKKFAAFIIKHAEWVKVESMPMESLEGFKSHDRGF